MLQVLLPRHKEGYENFTDLAYFTHFTILGRMKNLDATNPVGRGGEGGGGGLTDRIVAGISRS